MPEILVDQRTKGRATADPDHLATHGARLFVAAGAILLIGVLVDLFTLWVLQKQPTVEWEFLALSTTTNSYPLLLLSVTLLYGGLALGRSSSVSAYRLAAVLVLLLGVFGLTIGFLLGTNYLALTRAAKPTAQAAMLAKSQAMKAVGISLMFGGLMAIMGVLGLRLKKRG
jgi:hypothetical protein